MPERRPPRRGGNSSPQRPAGPGGGSRGRGPFKPGQPRPAGPGGSSRARGPSKPGQPRPEGSRPAGAGARGPSRPGQSRPEGSPPGAARPAPKRTSASRSGAKEPGAGDRLQKVLAHAGLGSRRACEELILQGRVTVNGQVVRELGSKVDPDKDTIAVDGQKVRGERPVYFAIYKPKGYVSTNNDPAGRPRVVDLLPEIPERVYTVGRLDEQSTGLILMTNDGELANKLAHPRFGVEKLYRVVVAGNPTLEVLRQLTDGIWLAEGKVRAKRAWITGRRGLSTTIEMVLAEGKNREVRRMLAKLGHKVMSLTRVAVGPITIKGLTPGQSRSLSSREVDLLGKVADGIPVPMPWSKAKEVRPEKPRRGAERGRTNNAAGGPPVAPTGGELSGPRGGSRPPQGGPPRPPAPGSRRPSAPARPGGPYASGGPSGPARGPSGNRPGAPPRAGDRPPPAPRGAKRAGQSEGSYVAGGPSGSARGPSGGRPPARTGSPSSGPRPPQARPPVGRGDRRPTQGSGGGAPGLPPVPSQPPPSQRRPAGSTSRPRPAADRPAADRTPKPPRSEPPTRRIIGLEPEEARVDRPRRALPKRQPRPLPKPRRRPTDRPDAGPAGDGE